VNTTCFRCRTSVIETTDTGRNRCVGCGQEWGYEARATRPSLRQVPVPVRPSEPVPMHSNSTKDLPVPGTDLTEGEQIHALIEHHHYCQEHPKPLPRHLAPWDCPICGNHIATPGDPKQKRPAWTRPPKAQPAHPTAASVRAKTHLHHWRHCGDNSRPVPEHMRPFECRVCGNHIT